jgi:hypothetical protein
MACFARLFRRISRRDAPHVHNLDGEIGRFPVFQSAEFIRLVVLADGRIELEGRPVRIENLNASLALESVYRPSPIVFYSRENPCEDSQVALEAVQCFVGLGPPIAFPPEATSTLNRIQQERGSVQ